MTTFRDIKRAFKSYRYNLDVATYTLLDHGKTKNKIDAREETLRIYNAAMRALIESAEVIKSSETYEFSLTPIITTENLVCNNIIASLSLSDNEDDLREAEIITKELFTYTQMTWMINQLRNDEVKKFIKYVDKMLEEYRNFSYEEQDDFEESIYNKMKNKISLIREPLFSDDSLDKKSSMGLETYKEALNDALELKNGHKTLEINNQNIDALLAEKNNLGVKVNPKLYKDVFKNAYFLSEIKIVDLLTYMTEGKLPEELGRVKKKKNH